MTEGQTMKRPKDKPSKGQTMIYKTQIQFSHRLLAIVLETTNSRTQGLLHFVESTNTGANEHKYFHSI
jgi:hypothetical protein